MPVLEIAVVFSNGGHSDQEPEDKSVRDERVPWWNPEAELEEEGVELNSHEHDTQAKDLDEPPWSKKRPPLVPVPLGRRELAQRPLYLHNQQ